MVIESPRLTDELGENKSRETMKNNIYLAAMGIAILFLSSCAQAPLQYPPYPAKEVISKPSPSTPMIRQSITHVVAPGETIWRISKMYNVKIKDIAHANNLKNPEKIKMGQHLLVPNAAPLRAVVPLYRSKKWKYIIIHHSATDVGSALSFDGAHHRRGFNRGLGYHFVISNGSKGKKDGQIEVSPRWIKQQDGAHCKAAGMNCKGIGICLVGNFNHERVSKAQMDSLVYLVNILKKYYRIPARNILGHGSVPGANTQCPGKNFPWWQFKRQIN